MQPTLLHVFKSSCKYSNFS